MIWRLYQELRKKTEENEWQLFTKHQDEWQKLDKILEGALIKCYYYTILYYKSVEIA